MSENTYPLERARALAVNLPEPQADATHVIVDEEYGVVLVYSVLSREDIKTGEKFHIYQLAAVHKPVHYESGKVPPSPAPFVPAPAQR